VIFLPLILTPGFLHPDLPSATHHTDAISASAVGEDHPVMGAGGRNFDVAKGCALQVASRCGVDDHDRLGSGRSPFARLSLLPSVLLTVVFPVHQLLVSDLATEVEWRGSVCLITLGAPA
jgi:hypothetical protein